MDQKSSFLLHYFFNAKAFLDIPNSEMCKTISDFNIANQIETKKHRIDRPKQNWTLKHTFANLYLQRTWKILTHQLIIIDRIEKWIFEAKILNPRKVADEKWITWEICQRNYFRKPARNRRINKIKAILNFLLHHSWIEKFML